MKNITNITSFTYTIKNIDNVISKEMEFKDYYKNRSNEENMLLYKHVVRDDGLYESFNKMRRTSDELNELIGSSRNKNKWFIHEYKNSRLSRKYDKDYNHIDFSGINKIAEMDTDDIIGNFYSNKTKLIKDKMD